LLPLAAAVLCIKTGRTNSAALASSKTAATPPPNSAKIIVRRVLGVVARRCGWGVAAPPLLLLPFVMCMMLCVVYLCFPIFSYNFESVLTSDPDRFCLQ
jgi:hypothetical protein